MHTNNSSIAANKSEEQNKQPLWERPIEEARTFVDCLKNEYRIGIMAKSFAGNSTDALAAVEDLQAKDLRIAFFGKTGEDVVHTRKMLKQDNTHTQKNIY